MSQTNRNTLQWVDGSGFDIFKWKFATGRVKRWRWEEKRKDSDDPKKLRLERVPVKPFFSGRFFYQLLKLISFTARAINISYFIRSSRLWLFHIFTLNTNITQNITVSSSTWQNNVISNTRVVWHGHKRHWACLKARKVQRGLYAM